MNWARGLTRVYVVLWALAALAGGVWAYSDTEEALRPRRELQDFLRRNKGVVSLDDLRTISTDTLANRIIDRVGAVTLRSPRGNVRTVDPSEYNVWMLLKKGWRCDTLALWDLKSDYSGRTPLEQSRDAARGDTAVKDIAWAWAKWLLVCGVAPAALLAIITWVVSGFAK